MFQIAQADALRLVDGRSVTIRPMRPHDAALQQAFVRNLSADARYHRFLSPIRELTPAMLQRLMQADVALLAEAAAGAPVAVAEARYVLDAAGDGEFAIAVADDWQGLGLGRLMLERLECVARANGVRRLVGDTLRVNRAMLGLARRQGFAARAAADVAWLVRLEKPLADRLSSPCGHDDARPALLAA